jgi:hypothetical protein
MDYDVIVVSGGLVGAALAMALAEHGAQVLVLEREAQFRDRVRGETAHSWGVADARRLGLHDLLLTTCAREVRWWRNETTGAPHRPPVRDLVATTPHHAGELVFYHRSCSPSLVNARAPPGRTCGFSFYLRSALRSMAEPCVTHSRTCFDRQVFPPASIYTARGTQLLGLPIGRQRLTSDRRWLEGDE